MENYVEKFQTMQIIMQNAEELILNYPLKYSLMVFVPFFFGLARLALYHFVLILYRMVTIGHGSVTKTKTKQNESFHLKNIE